MPFRHCPARQHNDAREIAIFSLTISDFLLSGGGGGDVGGAGGRRPILAVASFIFLNKTPHRK